MLQIFDDEVVNFEVIGEDRQILILKKNEVKHLYLYDYGNGMYKAFYMACAALQAENGILLIDELEAGIHHAALKKFVSFLNEICIEKNIQLFVTTHSLELVDVARGCHKKGDMVLYNIKMRNKRNTTIVKRLDENDLSLLRGELGVDIR